MAAEPGQYRLVWRKSAQADLDAIQMYLLKRSPEGAARMWLRITERVETLRNFPFSAPAVVSRPGLRLLTVPTTPYVVLYTVQHDQVRIEAVMHGAQDRDPR